MATKGNSLRDRQIASLKKILNLNEAVESSKAEEAAQANGLLAPVAPILDAEGNPIWKVLVFDDLGRDVISSVMRVSDLRPMGITMHMYVGDGGGERPLRHAGTLRRRATPYPTSPSSISSNRTRRTSKASRAICKRASTRPPTSTSSRPSPEYC